MLFAITCLDKPDSLALRQATRPAHLEYLAGYQIVLLGGPVLDPAGASCGSLLVLEAADLAEAEAFAAADPYAKAGLFASTTIQGFRMVVRDGVQV